MTIHKSMNLTFIKISSAALLLCAALSSQAQNERSSYADIIEPLMPTVVNIYTVKYPGSENKKKGGSFAQILCR